MARAGSEVAKIVEYAKKKKESKGAKGAKRPSKAAALIKAIEGKDTSAVEEALKDIVDDYMGEYENV